MVLEVFFYGNGHCLAFWRYNPFSTHSFLKYLQRMLLSFVVTFSTFLLHCTLIWFNIHTSRKLIVKLFWKMALKNIKSSSRVGSSFYWIDWISLRPFNTITCRGNISNRFQVLDARLLFIISDAVCSIFEILLAHWSGKLFHVHERSFERLKWQCMNTHVYMKL